MYFKLVFTVKHITKDQFPVRTTIFLADDGPERGRVQGNDPPSPTNLQGGNDEGTTSKETEDVDEKLGWKTIDRLYIHSPLSV
jgi:hypothetical protein